MLGFGNREERRAKKLSKKQAKALLAGELPGEPPLPDDILPVEPAPDAPAPQGGAPPLEATVQLHTLPPAGDDMPAGEEIPAPKAKKRGWFFGRNREVTVQTLPEPDYTVVTAMATHIGTRDYQQDAAYVSEAIEDDGMAFGILCDGMGGMDSGELVSSDVVAFFANRIAALPPDADIPAFYEQAVFEANEFILDRYLKNGLEGGTTLVSAIMRGGSLYWASVGDSRIYILRDGEMARVTRDHNYALQLQELVEAGRITQAEADRDPQREALVSYIGAPVLEVVDVSRGSFELVSGDTVLLCSDGLTKTLPDEAILALALDNLGDIAEAARVLPLAAFDASDGGQDNTSVILMQYRGPAPPAAQYIAEDEREISDILDIRSEDDESGQV